MVATTTVTASQQAELTIDVVANGVPGRIIFSMNCYAEAPSVVAARIVEAFRLEDTAETRRRRAAPSPRRCTRQQSLS